MIGASQCHSLAQKSTHDKARNHEFRRFGAGTAGLCRANAMGLMEAWHLALPVFARMRELSYHAW